MELWQGLQEVANDPQSADIEAVKIFLMNPDDPLVVDWDLEEEDGSKFPCDAEHFAKLPLDFLGLIVEAIGNDSAPSPQRGGTLVGGSQLKALPDPAPGGSELSEQPTGSDADLGN